MSRLTVATIRLNLRKADFLKILISAYACEPGAGSEPGAGWSWARAAATAGHQVWLFTRNNNGPALEAALAAEPNLPITPVYFDLPQRWRRWKRGTRGVHLYYLLWQLGVWRHMCRLHRQVHFDVAHHLTLATDWMPAAALAIPGVPAIWGPVGGTGSIPPQLYRWLGPSGVAHEVARELVLRPLRRLFGNWMARRASIVVAQNHDVARRFGRVGREVLVEPNVAIAIPIAPSKRQPIDKGNTRNAVFIGRLIPWKGLALAINALPHLDGQWRLLVVGEGRERARAARLAHRLGVSDRVAFAGSIPRLDVFAVLTQADVLLHPSMHDAAGWVVAEAAAMAVPVVCLDLGGPATLCRSGAGIPVSISPNLPRRLAQAIEAAATLQIHVAWSPERLPTLLDEWYLRAIGASGTSAKSAE